MEIHRKRGALVAGALATAGVAAFGLVASGSSSAASPQADAAKTKKVGVVLTEFKIAPAPKSVGHGRVTFLARNKGRAPHELVIIRTPRKAADLPTTKGLASEKGKVGKIPQFTGSKLHRTTVTLKKGHYALICNVPGHYAAKMYTDFTVS